MTDLENFIALYKTFGIELKVEKAEDSSNQFIELRDGDHEKLEGYSGFFSDVEFDKDGKFLKQGFWEG